MTGPEVAAIIGRHGIGYDDLARMLGVSERSVRRWVMGDHPVPLMVASVLVLMDRRRFSRLSFIRARGDTR